MLGDDPIYITQWHTIDGCVICQVGTCDFVHIGLREVEVVQDQVVLREWSLVWVMTMERVNCSRTSNRRGAQSTEVVMAFMCLFP